MAPPVVLRLGKGEDYPSDVLPYVRAQERLHALVRDAVYSLPPEVAITALINLAGSYCDAHARAHKGASADLWISILNGWIAQLEMPEPDPKGQP